VLIWGGFANDGTAAGLNDGARLNPITGQWTPISTVGAPSPRDFSSAVWTGSEMIVWGGNGQSGALADGARYNPTTDTWAPIASTGAPSARAFHSAVWTGSEMIVWGGCCAPPPAADFADGARYNPATNTWTPLAT
jgi:hypothetical protein